jgi:hypothetical protein
VFVRVRGEKGRRMKVRGGGVRSHSMQRLIYADKGGKVGYRLCTDTVSMLL